MEQVYILFYENKEKKEKEVLSIVADNKYFKETLEREFEHYSMFFHSSYEHMKKHFEMLLKNGVYSVNDPFNKGACFVLEKHNLIQGDKKYGNRK